MKNKFVLPLSFRWFFAAAAAILSGTVLAQSTWSNWDQGKAFEQSQRLVAQGKDPLPGPRDCFWRYGPSTGDPYLNIAFPDAKAVYWGAVFNVPKGSKLHIEGEFPFARYASLISYDFKGSPMESIADYLFKPTQGSINPFLDGADRTAKNRSYRIEVVNEPISDPMQVGVYLKGQTRDKIRAPAQDSNPQQQLQYRIYARDWGTDIAGNVSLPQAVVTLEGGQVLRGQAACQALRSAQPISGDPSAMAMSKESVQKLVEDAKKRVGPAGPATLPLTWLKTDDNTSRFAIYTGDTTIAPNARRESGSFYANQDNQYLRSFVSRKFGDVFVLRAKAPTTPKTVKGDVRWKDDAQLRYWSWCSNQGFGSGRVNDCLHDEEFPVDAQGFYTLVMSRAADRPRNAIKECGVGWLPMADVGDGSGETDLSLLVHRQMLGSGEFKEALIHVKTQTDLAKNLGPYMPQGRYTTTAAFETFRACLLEKR
jgi:hypothetical protein